MAVVPARRISRRTLFASAVGLPLLAACQPSDSLPLPGPGVVGRTGRLSTRHWPGHRPNWVLMRPRGVPNPPVVVSLHGKDGDARTTFNGLDVQRYIVSTGLAVASIDGGNYYWHARRSESTGADDISPDTPPCDTGAMVMDDFVPFLGKQGLDVSRIGLLGWSMGGYGALLLAATMGPSRVAAVAPMSAALWTEPGLSAPGAFDDAEDWARNNVFADRDRFAGLPIRLACGTSDPFYDSDQVFLSGFPTTSRYDVTGIFDPGGHDNTFWAGHAEGQMEFLARFLNQR
jgi:poly(3-hydroxybutyrate) depolymerase